MLEDLKIRAYVIHYLEKEAKTTTAKLDFSDKISEEDDFSKILISDVHKSINESSSLKNTVFKKNNSNDFSTKLEDYLSDSELDSFYLYTETLEKLKDKIEKVAFASGGYYFFCDYLTQGKRYITVVLLRKKNGINITKKDGKYTLDNSENVNIDKIAMAFRLNYTIFQQTEDDRNYIALITTQQNGEISNYFRDWVNAGDFIKDSKNTQDLVTIIKSLPIPLDTDGKPIYKNTNEFTKSVYEYAKPRANKMISIKDMSKHFYDDENTILDFAIKNNFQLDHEFKKDTRVWKRLVSIRARVEGIELNIDFNKINDNEVVVEENRIIINSKELTGYVASAIQARTNTNISENDQQ